MNRSVLFPAVVALIATATSAALADDQDKPIDAESAWVTSIAPLGGTSDFVAATADGLLLREASVVRFFGKQPEPAHSAVPTPGSRVVRRCDVRWRHGGERRLSRQPDPV